jgi:hypothetical protein
MSKTVLAYTMFTQLVGIPWEPLRSGGLRWCRNKGIKEGHGISFGVGTMGNMEGKKSTRFPQHRLHLKHNCNQIKEKLALWSHVGAKDFSNIMSPEYA